MSQDLELKLSELKNRVSVIEGAIEAQENSTDTTLPFFQPIVSHCLDYPASIIMDSNPVISDATRRYTVELNPDSGTHTNELQMRNVGTVPVSSERFPKFVTDSSGGGDLQWVALGAEEDYPWKVTVTEISPNNYQRSAQKGSWTRNTESGNTLLTLTTPDVGIVSSGNYVFAFIGRADLDKDPRLFPTVVGTNHSGNTTKAAVAGILAGLTPPVYYGGHVVLGKLTAGVWEQYWKGGDITDYLEVLDSDTVNHTPSGERHTIEHNPLAAERQGEMQLFDCDTASGAKCVPLLSMIDPDATPIVRELEWPDIDHYSNKHISTLEMHKFDDNVKVLSIMNANGVSATGKHAGYLDVSAVGEKEFKFAAIDSHELPPISKSIEVADGEKMRIYGFAGGSPELLSLSESDRVLFRHNIDGVPCVSYADPDILPYNGPPTDEPWPTPPEIPTQPDPPYVPPTDEPWPTNPDDLSHHALVDLEANDDHGGVSTAAAGAYVQLIGAAARNAMSGEIGDGSGVQSIDPTARTLDGAASETKGWKVTSTVPVSLDYFDTGALVVAGGVSVGESLQVDDDVLANKLFAASTADAVLDSSINTNGGIFAYGHVRAQDGFGNGAKDGITKNVSWEDVNGQVHTLEIAGGIITAYTVA